MIKPEDTTHTNSNTDTEILSDTNENSTKDNSTIETSMTDTHSSKSEESGNVSTSSMPEPSKGKRFYNISNDYVYFNVRKKSSIVQDDFDNFVTEITELLKGYEFKIEEVE